MTEINMTEEKEKTKSLVFVSEDDTFDIVVKYYEENGKLFVQTVDDEWKDDPEKVKNITLTLKYPSQGDYDTITHATKNNLLGKDFDLKQFVGLEFMRLLILVRKWTADLPLNNENMFKLNTKMVKAMILAIREKIGTEGII
jgi:hypothetical protein